MGTRSAAIRLLGISGSLRAESFSTALLKSLSKRAAPASELTIRTLEDIPLYNEDLDVEPALPAVAKLRAAIAESDGVVIATPEYNHGIPGVLKNALDWASRPAFTSCFRNKPVLIMSSAPGFTGGVRAQYQLRETLAAMHAQVVLGREVVVAGVHSKMSDGRFTDAASLDFMSDALARLRNDILSYLKIAA